MTSLLTTIAAFIVALGVLITVHEFGHFWIARRLGVKVLRFSVGFGRPLWVRRGRSDNTEFVIGAIPLGGYVKMLDEREGEVAEHEVGRAFNRQRLGVRIAIVAAGPVFNFLFAIFAYWLVFVAGETGTKPIVGDLIASSVADKAGMQAGDLIMAIDQQETSTWEAVTLKLLEESTRADRLRITVQRDVGHQETLWIDMGAADPQKLHRGQVLAALGITPERPVVPPVIDRVQPDGAAAAAGFTSGDRVLRADDQPIESWNQWVEYVRKRPEQWLRVIVERDGVPIELELYPARVEAEDGSIVGRIGAYVRYPEELAAQYQTEVRYGPLTAVGHALTKTWNMSLLMLRMLWRMLVGQASVENLSGPISIAQYAGQSASIGFSSFVKFLAIVSISLGVLNLLPIPVLDGGHLLYYLIEGVRGQPLSEQAQALGQQVGLVLLLLLMALAFYLDIERLFT